MRHEIVKGLSGKEIVFLTPETPEDHKILKEMEHKKELSSKASFGDWNLPMEKPACTCPEGGVSITCNINKHSALAEMLEIASINPSTWYKLSSQERIKQLMAATIRLTNQE